VKSFNGKQSFDGKQSISRWSRIALAAVLTGALGLAACGRKGPLEPPPSAALPQSPAYASSRPGLGEEHYGTPPGAAAAPAPAAAAAPAGPPPAQKTFFLDFLINK
jgi:predicted small lipoprotein YifL